MSVFRQNCLSSKTSTALLALAFFLPLLIPYEGFAKPGKTDPPVVSGNDNFDAAPFGYTIERDDPKAYGLRWAEPRKINRVTAVFADKNALENAGDIKLEYWHRHWDGKADPIIPDLNTGSAGWTHMDDWTNGSWREADTQVKVDGQRLIFTFAPTGKKELEDLDQPGVEYRKTLKIRLVSPEPLPTISRLQALTEADCRKLTVRILWGKPAEQEFRISNPETGHLEIFNGKILDVRPIDGSEIKVNTDGQFEIPADMQGGIEADIIMAEDPISQRHDRTIVTVRSTHRPFSFAVNEVAAGKCILVDDLGALVVLGDSNLTIESYRQTLNKHPDKSVFDRVFEENEQTLMRSWEDMPIKHQLYFVHGLPGNRNAMKQSPQGQIRISGVHRWFKKLSSPRDSKHKNWVNDFLVLNFGFPPKELRVTRELEDGYLPLLHTSWLQDGVLYELDTILDALDGRLDKIRVDDPTALFMKVRVLNTVEAGEHEAHLNLSSAGGHRVKTLGPEKIVLDGYRVWATNREGKPLRYLFFPGQKGTTEEAGQGLRWSINLKPGEAYELFFIIPAITLTEDSKIETLARRDFESVKQRVFTFWENLTAKCAKIQTPEPWLNDFYKSHLRHLQVNCWKDLEEAPRRYAHVGTFYYGVYANESAMMISDLDRRGYHEAAEQNLQTWLDFQDTVSLPGNFQSKEGCFYGANGQEMGGYNKHHGYVMWCMAEHWRYTHDREWMKKAAPKLIKACEWGIRERQATMKMDAQGNRPIEYGFLPAGGLEDVQDYWYWLATNVSTVWGFDALVDALADYSHPEAERLQEEAQAYHKDVLRGVRESRIRAPVVRLRDGTYVPKYPSRLYERGRCVGWIRETLEGSLCLLLTGLVSPDSPQARWIMKDYEDNLYISEDYGYSIPVFDKFWFSRGGFSMQSNLLDSPMPYMHMDLVKHYLRAYFNAFTAAYFPEIRMCNEHALPELGYPAGDHFKTSDEANSTYWLRLMFIYEDGKNLHLGRAIPRYWLKDGKKVSITGAATHFGRMSFTIESRSEQDEIEALVVPPLRNRPEKIYVRLRHPQRKPIKRVEVNGQSYDQFNTEKEWIILPGSVNGEQKIVAFY